MQRKAWNAAFQERKVRITGREQKREIEEA